MKSILLVILALTINLACNNNPGNAGKNAKREYTPVEKDIFKKLVGCWRCFQEKEGIHYYFDRRNNILPYSGHCFYADSTSKSYQLEDYPTKDSYYKWRLKDSMIYEETYRKQYILKITDSVLVVAVYDNEEKKFYSLYHERLKEGSKHESVFYIKGYCACGPEYVQRIWGHDIFYWLSRILYDRDVLTNLKKIDSIKDPVKSVHILLLNIIYSAYNKDRVILKKFLPKLKEISLKSNLTDPIDSNRVNDMYHNFSNRDSLISIAFELDMNLHSYLNENDSARGHKNDALDEFMELFNINLSPILKYPENIELRKFMAEYYNIGIYLSNCENFVVTGDTQKVLKQATQLKDTISKLKDYEDLIPYLRLYN